MLYQIKDLQKDTKRVNIVLKLVARQEPRYAKGFKITTFVAADQTGTILIPFWNEDGNTVKVGDTSEIQNGYISEFQGKSQLNVGKFGNFQKVDPPGGFESLTIGAVPSLSELEGSEEDQKVPISLEEFLGQKQSKMLLHLFISAQGDTRVVHTKLDSEEHRIVSYTVGDPTGCIQLDAWDGMNDSIEIGTSVCLRNASVKIYRDRRYLSLGQYSTITPLGYDVEINLKNNFSENINSFEE
jgi:replication factor A1